MNMHINLTPQHTTVNPEPTFFLAPTIDFNPIMSASVCYFNHADQILLLKRTSGNYMGDTWCVPGGKVEKDETALDALIREVHEEIGININKEKVDLIKTLYIRFPTYDFIFHMYYHKFLEKPILTLNLKEHQSFLWATVEEAKKIPLILGGDKTLAFYEHYINHINQIQYSD